MLPDFERADRIGEFRGYLLLASEADHPLRYRRDERHSAVGPRRGTAVEESSSLVDGLLLGHGRCGGGRRNGHIGWQYA
jgi:hypothetical protein